MYKHLCSYVALLFAIVMSSVSFGQTNENYEILNSKFRDYQIVEINANAVYRQLSELRSDGIVELRISEDITWKLNLKNSDIIANTYQVVEATENGLIKKRGTTALPMNGYVVGQPNSRVSLTFNDDFIYGFIKSGFSTYYIEPLYHFEKTGSKNKFVLYSDKDVIVDETQICGYELYQQELTKTKKMDLKGSGQRMPGGCYRVFYAIASDWSMVDHYGSNGTQNHNIGVLNNVQTNYDDEFADEIQFFLNEQWLSSCSTCDPWPSSTNSSTVLNSFTNWAISGFSNIHNLGSMWSRRDYNNGVIGLAWVGVLCSSFRYNILSDFSNNAQLKRVLMAHEIGHNFDASHNTGIMAPSVNTSNTWSNTSINEIQNHYLQASCLDNCPGSNPIDVDFTYDQIEFCIEGEISFSGVSNSATSWNWTFEGGTPNTSTSQFPVISYPASGTYEVTLEVSNGFNTATTSLFIDVEVTPFPIADFQFIINDLQVNLIYTGSGAESYEWNFGDGGFSSMQNPIHNYASNGTYNVSLTVFNDCGENTFTVPIDINALPFVNFTSNTQTGCAPRQIAFTSLSSNVDSIRWNFPGGIPATSTEQNPTVLYNVPGTYQVSLEGFNSGGSNIILRDGFIAISESPITGFDWVLDGHILNVTSTASGFDSIYYSFGYGNNSSEENPIHYYWENGTYLVTQHLVNQCGIFTQSDTVVVASPPLMFIEVDSSTICVNDSIQFIANVAFAPDSILWVFQGGTPSTSTESFPLVTYDNSGQYGVTLMAWNQFGLGSVSVDSLIIVNGTPEINFTYIEDTLVVEFTSNIQNGSNLLWNFGDGNTSSDANPRHIYQNYGDYIVSLSAENECGVNTNQQSVKVQSSPTANFTVSNDKICFGNQVTFINNSSSSATTYQWAFEGGTPATSNEKEPIITYLNPGVYNVTLTVSNSSGSDELILEDIITVDPNALASFTYTVNEFNFNGLFTGSVGADLEWSFGDGNKSTLQNPTNTYSSYGSYDVQLVAKNSCGTDTISSIVHIYSIPSGGFSSSSTWTCFGDTIQFTNESFGPYTDVQWIFEGGDPEMSTEDNPRVYYSRGGLFDVTLIVSNPVGSDTLIFSEYIEIDGVPTADFGLIASGLSIEGQYNGQFAQTFDWDFGDGNSSQEPNPTHQYALEGTYLVTLFVSNSCGIDSFTREIVVTTSSTEDDLLNSKFKLMPNPASHSVSIIIGEMFSNDFYFSIQNALGQELERIDSFEFINGNLIKDISQYKNGIYFITIHNAGRVITQPLIIID